MRQQVYASKINFPSIEKIGQKFNHKFQDVVYRLSPLMTTAFCYTAMGTTSNIVFLMPQALVTGGPAIIFWGWIIISAFQYFGGMALGEICSKYPYTGTVYVWTGKSAKPQHSAVLSLVCGYSILLGAITSQSILFSILDISYGYEINLYLNTFISLIVLLISSSLNFMKVKYIGYLNEFIALFQIIVTILLIIIFLCFNKVIINRQNMSSLDFVLFNFHNETNIPNSAYVAILGLTLPIYALSGYDAGGQLGEQTENPNLNAPLGIMKGLQVSTISGFLLCISILFGMGAQNDQEMSKVLQNSSKKSSIIVYLVSIIFNNSPWMSLLISVLLYFVMVFANINQLIYSIRVVLALSRDKGLPYSDYFSKLDPVSDEPVYALIPIIITNIFLMLFGCFYENISVLIASVVTLNYIFPYLITVCSSFYNKENDYTQNQFNLGKHSKLIGKISIVFYIFACIIQLLPQQFDHNGDYSISVFNYNLIIMILYFFLVYIYWKIKLQDKFQGPVYDNFE